MSKPCPIQIFAALFTAAIPVFAGPVEDLAAWLKADRKTRPALEAQAFATASLSAAESEQAKVLLWADRTAFVKAEWGAQWTGKRLVDGALNMRFDFRTYGAKPAAGYDFYISMHGGGGVAASVNDQQWQNQITLYQPPGVYLSPRAPTDAWNMWHKDHIDTFFDRLIHLAVAQQEVNPDRVYVMGYSAGGDGAYHMTPRMADRWAAGAMMAGYPNSASPVNLRNIGMTLHVGALDAAFGRNTQVLEFGKLIQKLQDADPGFYKYVAKAHAGKGHWMDLEDAEALPWMQAFTRNPHPKKVVWLQDTTVGTNSFPSGPMVIVKGNPTQWRFYWVERPDRKPLPVQARITAEILGQEVHVRETNLDSVAVCLNDKLLDLSRPVALFWKGAKVHEGILPRTVLVLQRSVEARGDREMNHPVRVVMTAAGIGVGLGEPARTRLRMDGMRVKRGGGDLEIRWPEATRNASVFLRDATGRNLAMGNMENGVATLPVPKGETGLRFLEVRSGTASASRKILLP